MRKRVKHIALFFLWLFLIFQPFMLTVLNAQNAYKSEKDLKKNADMLFNKENFVAALPLFSQLLSLYPKNPDYSYKFGTCLLMADKRDIEKPIQYLEAASKSPEVEKQVLYYLGLAFHYNYRFKEAINAYNQFLQQAPRSLHKKYNAARQIEMCYNGISLLSTVGDLYVLDKQHVGFKNFYRSYSVTNFGGRFLTVPPELKSKVDVKKEHNTILFFSENAEVLYYSSYGLTEDFGKDIYYVEKTADGTWDVPHRMPALINTEYDEDYPFMLSDGVTLFFSSKGHNSMGGYDIFRTVLDTNTGTWSKPENLDFAINTPFDDILFITNEDMTSAYFASNRVSDIGMINVYKVHLEARDDKEQTAMGDVFNLSKDDPSYKRSLELLKNRTKLDVNATEAMFDKPVIADNKNKENKQVAVNSNKQPDNITETQPLTNQDIIKLAYKQSDEVNAELIELKEKMNATKMVTEQRKQRALIRLNDARRERESAQRLSNPKQRENALIDASKIQSDADRLQKEAEVAENIYNDIQKKVIQKEAEVKDAEAFAENIKKAIESDSPEKAMDILNKMNNEMVSEDVSAYTEKSVEEIIANADAAIPAATNVSDLINEVQRLNSEADRLKKQAEKTKNVEEKNDLLEQARNNEMEAKQVQSEINNMAGIVAENTDNVNNADNNKNPVVPNNNVPVVTDNQKQDLINQRKGVENAFKEASDKLEKQQEYLLSEAYNKAEQSNKDYNKAQGLMAEAGKLTDISLRDKKMEEASKLLESAEKNMQEALADRSVADLINNEIESLENNERKFIADTKQTDVLLDNKEYEKAKGVINEAVKKYPVVNNTLSLDEKTRNELLNKAQKADAEADNLMKSADNLYNKLLQNNKDVNNLKQANTHLSDKKEIEKNNKQIEQLQKENIKIKTDADNAFKKANEMKFETGKLRMEVSVRTQVIPEKEKSASPAPPEMEMNTVAEFQEKLITEKTKIIEATHNEPPNNALADANNDNKEKQPEVKIPDEEIKKKSNDVISKSEEAVKVFEVKANKLYNYAGQKTDVSKLGIAQADKILQNAQNMTDAALKNKEIDKANKLYEKSFEQAQEALAAVNLAKQYDDKAKELTGNKEQLKNNLDNYQNLAKSGKFEEAEKLIQELSNNYDTVKIEDAFKNQVAQATENSINNKQREAQDLLNQSKKQYDEAVKLKEEAKQLYEQVRNTPDVNQKNNLINNAEQKEKQANAVKQQADDNNNKAEKIKIEVGVLKMKVEFTVSVEEMPEPQAGTPANKNAALADAEKLEEKIKTHNYSETSADNKRFEEVIVKPVTVQNTQVADPPVRIDVSKINNEQQLEAEVKKNSQLAAQEKQKANAAGDEKQRLDLQSRAEVYEQNANDAKVKIYDIKADNNSKLANSNKATLQQVKVVNNNDENARKARMLEDEANIYLQKAEQRKNEARNSPVAALKPNLLEDAVKNQELALQKQNEAIAYYKKAQPQTTQLVTQNTNQNTNNQTANNPANNTRPVTNNNQNQNTLNNPPINQNNNTRPALNNQQQPTVQQNPQAEGNLISNIKGLFFTVQVGVFGAARTSAQLLNLSPLYYDKLGNGFFRYFAGVFSSKDGAVALKNDVVARGIPDAFVVAFNNGTRITVNDALALLQNGKAQLQNQLAFTAPPATANNQNVPAQTGQGLYYAVQIGVYKQQRPSSQLFNISPISYEPIAGGFNRHLTGNFAKRIDADNLKNDIVRKGIDDAFVVAYLNGRRITLAEARNIEGGAPVAVNNQALNNTQPIVNQNQANQPNVQPNNPTPVVTPSNYKPQDIRFRVQIGAFKDAVSSLILSQYRNLLGEDIDAIRTDAGLTLYLVGSFKDFLEASALRNKIVNKGIADAFVVAYHKKERIPLNVARELLK